MATLHAVLAAIQSAVSGVVPTGAPGVNVGIGWPPFINLQRIAQGGPSQIGVFDRKVGRNTTRWNSFSYNQVVVPATLTTAISPSPNIPPSGSALITLGSVPTVGDGVSAVLTSFSTQPATMVGEVAVAVSGDTASSMATKLAALVNADTVMSLWASASAAGPVVTITNLSSKLPLVLASYAGNGGSETTEVGRRERQFQITCWAKTEVLRQAITDPIDTMLGTAELNFGLVSSDGTQLRIMYDNDYYIEDNTLADVYRRDFLARVDFPITTTDLLYAVLAPITTTQEGT